jgi:hypothetical protein
MTTPPTKAPPMKPGDTRTVDGVEYACVVIHDGGDVRSRANDVIRRTSTDAMGAMGAMGGICRQCPYLRTEECYPRPSACGATQITGGSTIIVRLDTVPLMALEGVLL